MISLCMYVCVEKLSVSNSDFKLLHDSLTLQKSKRMYVCMYCLFVCM